MSCRKSSISSCQRRDFEALSQWSFWSGQLALIKPLNSKRASTQRTPREPMDPDSHWTSARQQLISKPDLQKLIGPTQIPASAYQTVSNSSSKQPVSAQGSATVLGPPSAHVAFEPHNSTCSPLNFDSQRPNPTLNFYFLRLPTSLRTSLRTSLLMFHFVPFLLLQRHSALLTLKTNLGTFVT